MSTATLTPDHAAGASTSSSNQASTLDNRLREAGGMMAAAINDAARSTVAVWLDAGDMALEIVGDAACNVGGGKRFANGKESRTYVYDTLAGLIQSEGVAGVSSAAKSRKAVAGKLRDWSGVSVIAEVIGRDRLESIGDSDKARALAKLAKWDNERSMYSPMPEGTATDCRNLVIDHERFTRAEFKEEVAKIVDPSRGKESKEVKEAREKLDHLAKRDDLTDALRAEMAEMIYSQFPSLHPLAEAKKKAEKPISDLVKLANEYGEEIAFKLLCEVKAALKANQAAKTVESEETETK